ncbi:MAG: hypothetical protein AB7F86_01215 [Bdellovibrionales bacterium]
MYLKFTPILIFSLLPLFVGACGKNDAPENSVPPQYDWGHFVFNLENPASQLSAHLTRIVGAKGRTLNVELKITAAGQCTEYNEIMHSQTSKLRGDFNTEWSFVTPKGEGRPCQAEPGGLTISSEEWTSIQQGRHRDLQARGSYILIEEEVAQVPELPVSANLGTRTLLFQSKARIDQQALPVAAIVDLEKRRLVGLAIDSTWLEDTRSDESFPTEMGKFSKLLPVHVDKVDQEFKSQRCRLQAGYVRHLEQSESGLPTQPLKEFIKSIKTPTKECP